METHSTKITQFLAAKSNYPEATIYPQTATCWFGPVHPGCEGQNLSELGSFLSPCIQSCCDFVVAQSTSSAVGKHGVLGDLLIRRNCPYSLDVPEITHTEKGAARDPKSRFGAKDPFVPGDSPLTPSAGLRSSTRLRKASVWRTRPSKAQADRMGDAFFSLTELTGGIGEREREITDQIGWSADHG